MNSSEHIDQLLTALAKAQGKITPALKDKTNPFFKSSYADLSSVWNACRQQLSENGLSVMQTVGTSQTGGMMLVTTLGHSSGQWMRSEMPIILQKQDPQALGSAITYYRRYSLAAIVGVVADEDDDGNTATHDTSKGKPAKVEKMPFIDPVISEAVAIALEKKFAHLPEYKEEVLKYLASKNINSFRELPVSLLEKVSIGVENKLRDSAKKVVA
jgi:hypothetical protein